MIYSLTGTIVDVTSENIAVDLGNIAYVVFVPRPGDFSLGEQKKVYIHEILTQDDHYLAGFETKMERDAFQSLIQVKGIGPKTALSALSGTTPDLLLNAIASADTKYLKKLPGIGPKAASQIILDLQGKLVQTEVAPKKDERYPSIRAALKSMGYKVKEIDDAIATLPDDLDENTALRTALKFFRKDR